MRILVASPYLPWPLSSGGNAVQFTILQCLASDHDFTLVCPILGAEENALAQELAKQLPRIRIRAVSCGEPLSDSGAVRTLRRALRFAQRAIAPKVPPVCLPSYPFDPLPPPFVEALREELNRGTDLFQAEYVPMLSFGAWFPREIPRLFVHYQVHFVYAERFLETHGAGASASYLQTMMRVQELAYLQHFDGVITLSEEDRGTLLSHLPATRVFTSPSPIPADVGVAREIPQHFDGRFLFVASDVHDPNLDALEWLLAEIWPRIVQQLPAARLLVVGQWSRANRSRFAAPGLSFTGFVDDLPATLRGGIMLVPVRIGSGIRVKILVALAQGVAVVTTPVGVEGLLARDGEEVLVREEAAEFAAAAVQLAQQPDLRNRLALAGCRAVSQHYSADAVRRRRNEIYEAVVANGRHRASSEMRDGRNAITPVMAK